MRVIREGASVLVETGDENETDRLGRVLAELLDPDAVIGLIGTLGAGKTRLVRAIAEGLGADPRAVSSPTYVLIHEYEARLPVYHFDTYRLSSAAEFDDLGAADYWSAGGICLVEWADRVLDRLPSEAWLVRIESTGPTGRRFRFEGRPDLAARLAERLA